jgi:hypothetical protein
MKSLSELSRFRIYNEKLAQIYGEAIFTNDLGAFTIPYVAGDLHVLASNSHGWDHVSVSKEKRIPNWLEMDFIKKLFFKDDEYAFQYHVPASHNVNIHQNCLHLWRPQNMTILLPPKILV